MVRELLVQVPDQVEQIFALPSWITATVRNYKKMASLSKR